MRAFLSTILLSSASLWAGASPSFAHEISDGYGVYDDGCGHDAAPSQAFGPVRMSTGPLALDVSQDGSGNVMASIVSSQVPLSRLDDSRLRLGFRGFASGDADSTVLYYSPANRAYYGQLPAGTWLGAAPLWAQVDFAQVIVAPAPPIVVAPPPPVVHVQPYPYYPPPRTVVVRPRVLPRRVFVSPRNIPAPPVVRVSPWTRVRDDRRFEHGRERRDGHSDRDGPHGRREHGRRDGDNGRRDGDHGRRDEHGRGRSGR